MSEIILAAPPPAWKRALAKARSNPTTAAGALICLIIIVSAVFAPWLAPL